MCPPHPLDQSCRCADPDIGADQSLFHRLPKTIIELFPAEDATERLPERSSRLGNAPGESGPWSRFFPSSRENEPDDGGQQKGDEDYGEPEVQVCCGGYP